MAFELYDPSALSQPPWRTERLVLRPYQATEAAAAHTTLDCDEEVWRYDPGHAPSLAERQDNIARFAMLRRQFGFGPCAAFLVAPEGCAGPLIGQGGLNPYVYDHRDGRRTVEFEVMYKLARPYWGAGFATEIASFWTRFAFEEVRLPRLCIGPERENVRSVRVLERLGARIEDDWLDAVAVIATIENPALVLDPAAR